MIAELFTNNALNLVIIFGSCAALILMSFWFRRGDRKRKGFLFHAVQFLIYTIIISAVGSIINYVIENYKLKFITPGVIDFICTSLIAVILTIKLFLLINQFEKQQIKKRSRYHQCADHVAHYQNHHYCGACSALWRTFRHEPFWLVDLWWYWWSGCRYGR